ncbi:unnamed protein product [Urochloa decumbens]|uniref:Uncharacterized protein n=1 Tax=Urochloa decumbens TaxID=240449 RepID=A0ABC9AMM3_9POAL
MELATAALSNLLPKLGTLLTDEYKLQKGFRGEIRFLKAEMESMLAALHRVSKQPPNQIDALQKIWVRDLKELVYDIEDSVDVFMVQIDAHGFNKPHSFRRFFDRTIGLLTKAKHRHHIADDIQEIKIRIQEVTSRREKYKSEHIIMQPVNKAMDPRLPALYEEVQNLVSIDGPAEQLTALLMHEECVQNQQLMVVSIFGAGGLGKTTLANSVYQRLVVEFHSHAFVSVSLKPDIKKIFSSILRQVSEKDYHNAEAWNDTELVDNIREILSKKRYIIIIDDLWSESAWTQIKCALIENNLGSRVIVTTRNASVAKFCSPIDGTMYKLDPLSYEDSKRLLYKRVFNEEEEIHSELEEVSWKILKKCGGVPLAIITIASLLASRPNKTKYEWYSVYKSMGSGLEKDKTMENMREILYLSYDDLPSYLKPCLLYLSMFPEDHVIREDILIPLWVAEGFVDEKQGSHVYDIGQRYFNELINRSMIQPIYMNELEEAWSCRLHDMILDLVISLAVQENFFTTISHGSLLVSPVHNKLRRLSLQGSKVYSNKEESKEELLIVTETVNMSNVRSLLSFGETSQPMPPLARFSVLRVLSLEYFPCKNMYEKDLGSLHHLRYLKLGGHLETEILEEIGNLQLLTTLDLSSSSTKELPASIVRLRKLELLRVPGKVKFPDGIGNLMSLRYLSLLDMEESPCTLAELGSLVKLTWLGISGLHAIESYIETFLRSLSNLGNLCSLYFQGVSKGSLDCMPDEWRGPAQLQYFYGNDLTFSKVPRWFSSLFELSILSIRIELLRQEDMKLLGSLTVLRFLKLIVDEDGSTDERLVVSTDQPFRSLEEFKFKHHTRCCLLLVKGVMPKLQKLKLYFQVRRREGGGFDTRLENLASLKHVAVKVNCKSSRITEVEDAETKIRDAIGMNQNHPTLKLSRVCEDEMVID